MMSRSKMLLVTAYAIHRPSYEISALLSRHWIRHQPTVLFATSGLCDHGAEEPCFVATTRSEIAQKTAQAPARAVQSSLCSRELESLCRNRATASLLMKIVMMKISSLV